MTSDYRSYAKELYTIKLAVLKNPYDTTGGCKPDELLVKLAELRPKLRLELTQLAQEFIATCINPPQGLATHMDDINNLYMKKLQVYANSVRKAIRNGQSEL